MQKSSGRACGPNLLRRQNAAQQRHSGKAQKAAAQRIQQRHDLPGGQIAEQDADDDDGKRVLPAEGKQREERDDVAQAELHARHGEGNGDLRLEHEDRQRNGGQQRAARQPFHPHGRPSLARLLPNLSSLQENGEKVKNYF